LSYEVSLKIIFGIVISPFAILYHIVQLWRKHIFNYTWSVWLEIWGEVSKLCPSLVLRNRSRC